MRGGCGRRLVRRPPTRADDAPRAGSAPRTAPGMGDQRWHRVRARRWLTCPRWCLRRGAGCSRRLRRDPVPARTTTGVRRRWRRRTPPRPTSGPGRCSARRRSRLLFLQLLDRGQNLPHLVWLRLAVVVLDVDPGVSPGRLATRLALSPQLACTGLVRRVVGGLRVPSARAASGSRCRAERSGARDARRSAGPRVDGGGRG